MRHLYICEIIIVLTYAIISGSLTGGLTGGSLSRKANRWIWGIVLGIIVLMQSALLISGQDLELVITVLPVTAFLPLVLGVFFLTNFNPFQSAAIWTLGFLAVYILKVEKRIMHYLGWYRIPLTEKAGLIFLIFFTASILVFIVFRFFRKPFHRFVEGSQKNWLLLCFPVLLSFLFLSYFLNSKTNITMWVLVLCVSFSIFVMIIRTVVSQVLVSEKEESERKMEMHMRAQRQEYEEVCKKMDAGRIYRHDMRHHVLVLRELAMQEDMKGVLSYIENMSVKLSETEREVYCSNKTINAVISSRLSQARKAHCAITAKISLPEEVPYDEMDICMVLANAIENAQNACEGVEEEKRYIHIIVELLDSRKLFVSIKNPYRGPIYFDENGVPAHPDSEEHGIGMKSIQAITDKYHGFFQCKCHEEEFNFHAVMFGDQGSEPCAVVKKRNFGKKLVSSLFFSGIAVVVCFACVPEAVQALGSVTGSEVLASMAKVYSGGMSWGDTFIDVEYPILDGAKIIMNMTLSAEDYAALAEGMEEMNAAIEEYVGEIKKKFRGYLARKCDGNVGCDIYWETLRDDERYLVVKMIGTINVGGSGEYNHYYTLDKSNGSIVKLKDLFLDDSDYIGVISDEIVRQMIERIEKKNERYYVSGYGWREEDCFRRIDKDQNFYVNEQNQLVIAFDEYEVAPGSMGMPEFVIDRDILEDILRSDSILGTEGN